MKNEDPRPSSEKHNEGRAERSEKPSGKAGTIVAKENDSEQPVFNQSGTWKPTAITKEQKAKPMNNYEQWDAERKEFIKADIIIAQDGENWAVISLSGYYLKDPHPEVLQSGLTRLEAAEACRECHIFNAMDDALHSHPYHPGSEVPLEHFNTRGIITAELKSFDVQVDIPRIANCIAIALEAGRPNNKQMQIANNIPF